MKLFLCLQIVFFNFLFSIDTKKVSAIELLEMEESKSFLYISKLNKEETASLITQIRTEARKNYKDIDKFYILISHLESIKSIEEEQTRLKSLNSVYILGLILLISILVYIILSQRKSMKQIENLMK